MGVRAVPPPEELRRSFEARRRVGEGTVQWKRQPHEAPRLLAQQIPVQHSRQGDCQRSTADPCQAHFGQLRVGRAVRPRGAQASYSLEAAQEAKPLRRQSQPHQRLLGFLCTRHRGRPQHLEAMEVKRKLPLQGCGRVAAFFRPEASRGAMAMVTREQAHDARSLYSSLCNQRSVKSLVKNHDARLDRGTTS